MHKVINIEKNRYLFWCEHKLFTTYGEGDVRHGCKSVAVHG